MSKKIILFLSPLTSRSKEAIYTCPDGTAVEGKQTNEAPVSYLLNHYGAKDTTVICIVSETARKVMPELDVSGYEHFCEYIKKEYGDEVRIEAIPCPDDISGNADNKISEELLQQILEKIGPESEILLEMTGGFRDAATYLLLLSRIISYTGSPLLDAVYSNLEKEKIVSNVETLRLFSLIEGMQNLTYFGRVKTLREYYAQASYLSSETSQCIKKLIEAMEELFGNISLCRSGNVSQSLAKLNVALKAASQISDDALFSQLLPTFKKKFAGDNGKIDTIGLIRWCTDNGMLQQAITLYVENTPELIVGQRNSVITVVGSYDDAYNKDHYKGTQENSNKNTVTEADVLNDCILRRDMEFDKGKSNYGQAIDSIDGFIAVSSSFKTRRGANELKHILRDYLYIKLLRNMANHADANSNQKKHEWYLIKAGYQRLASVDYKTLPAIIESACDRLQKALH